LAEEYRQLLTGGHQKAAAVLVNVTHPAQGSGDKLIGGYRQPRAGQDIKKAKGLAELSYLIGRAEVNKTVNPCRLRRQIMIQSAITAMAHYQRVELTLEELR
jgi:hypothetical protein